MLMTGKATEQCRQIFTISNTMKATFLQFDVEVMDRTPSNIIRSIKNVHSTGASH